MGQARNGTVGHEMAWARNGTGMKWDSRARNGTGTKWDRHEMAGHEMAGTKWTGTKWPGTKWDIPGYRPLSDITAIPRLVRTSLSALSLSAHQQILTIPRFVRMPFSLSAHFAQQNWCNLTIFG